MVFQFKIYFFIFAINTAVALTAAHFLWKRRQTPSAKTLFWLNLAAAEWSLAVGLEAAAVSPNLKTLFSKIEYIGFNCTAALLLVFALEYTQKHDWLKPKRIILYWLIPITTILLAATNEWHHLIWSGFSNIDSETNLRIYNHGPWFWVNIASIYVNTAVATLLFIQKAFHTSPIYRHQISSLLIGVAAPWIGSLIYILGLSPIPGLNIVPITFTITGLFIIWGLFRYQLFDLVPFARTNLIDIMSEAVLVIDEQMRIVDINLAAQKLFELPHTCIGEDIEFAMAAWPGLTELCQQTTDIHKEILLNQEAPLCVDVRISHFNLPTGQAVGKLIVISNITKRYKAVLTLFEVNEELQKRYDEIAALQAQLKEQAISDALTGLLNRHHLGETLPKEISRAKRGAYPLTLIMLDIDGFKQVNDMYGHDAGDSMLLTLGDIISKQTRFEDFAYRYGGEEFLLILPGLGIDKAIQRAEKIRQLFETFTLEHENKFISATLSAGVATYPQHGKDQDELLRASDQALYAAKADGRNCIRGFS
jgi:diguanylate cyclase (GGDEF)-like protein